MQILPRGALWSVFLAAACLAACSSGASTVPGKPPSVTPTASATGPALPLATVTTVPAAGVPVPLPSATIYDLAGLATFLGPAQPVPAGQAGTFGTITAIAGTTLTVTQILGSTGLDSTGVAPDFVQNYASVGTAGGTITVSLAPNGFVAAPNGFADLRVGQNIVAGGTATGSQLAAVFIAVMVDSGAQTSSVHRGAAITHAATTRKGAAAGVPSGYASVSDALVGTAGIPGGVHLPASEIHITTGTYVCPGSLGTSRQSATLAVVPDAAIALPGATANFPYRLDYQPTPAPYVANGSAFSGPGPASQWLQFAALPAPGATSPTYDVSFRADAGINVILTEGCTARKFTLLGVSVGYGYESSTTSPIPSGQQTVQLVPVKCIDVNIPLHFSIPLPGPAGLNPFGSSEAGIDICGKPTIAGIGLSGVGSITGTPTNLQGASTSGGAFGFDPSMSGPASVATAPTLNATAAMLSFTLPLSADLIYTDGETVEYTVFGTCVIGIPSCQSSTAGGVPILPAFTSTVRSQTPQTISLHAPLFATCSITDSVQQNNNLPPSTNCNTSMRIDAVSPIPGVLTISNLPFGTYTYSGAAQGRTSSVLPTCDGANYASYFTVSPTSVTGSSATFTFRHTAATGQAQSACTFTIVDQNNHAVLFSPTQAVQPPLLIVPSGG